MYIFLRNGATQKATNSLREEVGISQLAVEALHGEAHNVVEGALDVRDANVADPLLYAVGARFVERMVVRHVVIYLAVRERCEGDPCMAGEGALPLGRGERNARDYLMLATAQEA